MTECIMVEISKQYRLVHENLLDLVDGLTDEQIGWISSKTTPCVGFHVWHLSRWAEYLQEIINGHGSQMWEKEEMAARRAFALAEQAVETIKDNEFFMNYETLHGENWHDGHIGPIILTWMEHDHRHLGMIECLIGVQGMHGSADS